LEPFTLKEPDDFLKKVIDVANKLSTNSSVASNVEGCPVYSNADITNYLGNNMKDSGVKKFEEHAFDCNACLRSIYLEKDKLENKTLFQKALQTMDRLDEEEEKNIITVVLKVTGKFVELIRTTGELLGQPILVPVHVRGEDESRKHAEPIRILREFMSPPLSIQGIAESGENPGEVKFTISVYDHESDKFVPGLDIILTGPKTKEKTNTDENGLAAFIVSAPNDYDIVIHTLYGQEIGFNISLNE
jgi:hypothetical protein